MSMQSIVSLLFVLALLPKGYCVQSRFDEYLWTKSSWSEFKLNKPRDRWRVEDAPLVYQRSRSLHLQGCSFVSTDGPGAVSPSPSDNDIRPDWLTAIVDGVLAGATVFGSVCGTAVEEGWKSIMSDVYDRQLPSSDKIEATMEDVCVEAVEDVLGRFILKKEASNEINIWRLVPREDGDRDNEEESQAIELACERFMRQRRDIFTRAMNEAAMEFDETLKGIVEKQLEAARGPKAQERMLEDHCEDIHPRCEFWADKGECVLNPNYMLNYCRVSCGVCKGDTTFIKSIIKKLKNTHVVCLCRVGAYYLNENARWDIASKGDELGKKLKLELCPMAKPDLIKMDEIPYQPVLKGREIEDISRALMIELNGKCLLLHHGRWSYEVCFFKQIRQIRYDEDGETVIESYLAGSFGEQLQRHMKALLLTEDETERYGIEGGRRPYILQTYENGDLCEDRLTRSAEVRLMCSEGLKQSLSVNVIGVTVEETKACHYVFNIFLSLMCHYPDYAHTEQ